MTVFSVTWLVDGVIQLQGGQSKSNLYKKLHLHPKGFCTLSIFFT